MASKIEDHGFISNMQTGALVSRSADIDWLCARLLCAPMRVNPQVAAAGRS
jgi:hypothetical protein